MANEDSRNNSVLSSALTLAGIGVVGYGASKLIGKRALGESAEAISKKNTKNTKQTVKEVAGNNDKAMEKASEQMKKATESVKPKTATESVKPKTASNQVTRESLLKETQDKFKGYDDIEVGQNVMDKDGEIFVLTDKSKKNKDLGIDDDMYVYKSLSGKHSVQYGKPISEGNYHINNVYEAKDVEDYLSSTGRLRAHQKTLNEMNSKIEKMQNNGEDVSELINSRKRFINGQYTEDFNEYSNVNKKITEIDSGFKGSDKVTKYADSYIENLEKYGLEDLKKVEPKQAKREVDEIGHNSYTSELNEANNSYDNGDKKLFEPVTNKKNSLIEPETLDPAGYAAKYGKPTKSKSRWRNYLRQNEGSDDLADKAGRLISNSNLSLIKNGADGYKNAIVDGNDISESFEYISKNIGKESKGRRSYNIHDVINANGNGEKKKAKKMMDSISDDKEYNKELLESMPDRFADSDELVTVIHGGSESRIKRFLENGGGSYPIEMEIGSETGNIQKTGIQLHSNSQSRATHYASSGGGVHGSTPTVMVAQVPAKYLHRNANRTSGYADEFMLPQEHWDKIVNHKLFNEKNNPKEWHSSLFYDDTDELRVADEIRKKLNITDR